MRILSLQIWGYKNLKNFKVEFDKNSPFTFLIGENGSGKSNLIEALLHIFYALETRNLNNVDFNFEMEYIINERTVHIKYPNEPLNEISINGVSYPKNLFKTIKLDRDLPEYIFTYYSGTCERIRKKVGSYNKKFREKLKERTDFEMGNEKELKRKIDHVDIKNIDLLFASLYALNPDFLREKFKIETIENIKLKLVPGSNFDFEKHAPRTLGLEGELQFFPGIIEGIVGDHNVEDEFYKNQKPKNEFYENQKSKIKYYNNQKSLNEFDDEFVRLFSNTYTFNLDNWEKLFYQQEKRYNLLATLIQLREDEKVLKKISYDIILKTGEKITIDQLSEGEKQLLLVLGMIMFNKDKQGIFLLDEPDTHLNPTWSIQFRDLLKKALNGDENNHFFISTHCPMMFAGTKKEEVLMFQNGKHGIVAERPHNDPRGMGIAGILTNEFFGLASALDLETQKDMDRRLTLAYQDALSEDEKDELRDINERLLHSGILMSYRDPNYAPLEKAWKKSGSPKLNDGDTLEVITKKDKSE